MEPLVQARGVELVLARAARQLGQLVIGSVDNLHTVFVEMVSACQCVACVRASTRSTGYGFASVFSMAERREDHHNITNNARDTAQLVAHRITDSALVDALGALVHVALPKEQRVHDGPVLLSASARTCVGV